MPHENTPTELAQEGIAYPGYNDLGRTARRTARASRWTLLVDVDNHLHALRWRREAFVPQSQRLPSNVESIHRKTENEATAPSNWFLKPRSTAG